MYVVDKNTIAEAGTHDELIKQQGVYRKIWDSQMGEEPLNVGSIQKPVTEKANKNNPIDESDDITYN